MSEYLMKSSDGKEAVLKIGDHVKVACNGERFWCKVLSLENGIKTEVQNNVVNQNFKNGDILNIEHEHIVDYINNSEA